MMEKFGFLYDNTMSVSDGPYWPQTLAYNTAWKCSSSNCPKRAHPNVWEIPINRFTALGSQKEFSMLKEAIRACFLYLPENVQFNSGFYSAYK